MELDTNYCDEVLTFEPTINSQETNICPDNVGFVCIAPGGDILSREALMAAIYQSDELGFLCLSVESDLETLQRKLDEEKSKNVFEICECRDFYDAHIFDQPKSKRIEISVKDKFSSKRFFRGQK